MRRTFVNTHGKGCHRVEGVCIYTCRYERENEVWYTGPIAEASTDDHTDAGRTN